MEKLYLDNYRGFTNQYIEIRDINFLVGENSTGKSSVLFALKTIFSEKFWSSLDFSVSEGQGYSFEDLVSASAPDKTYFRLGYIFDRDDETSFIFEFINDGGRPVLSKSVISFDGTTFYFKVTDKKNVFYFIQKKKLITFDGFEKSSQWENLEPINSKTGAIVPSTLVWACVFNKNSPVRDSLPVPVKSIDFTAPIRSKPRKTYDEPATPASSEGGHIPYLLRRLFAENGTALRKSLNNFGKQSGLFDDIEIKEYGVGFDAPFRLNFLLDKTPVNIINLGYGVSQVLPILVTSLVSQDTVFEIQQPEVHLHPRAQAALGDVFFDITTTTQKKFLIETHSDYLIDRFRQRQKKAEKKAIAHVLFFARQDGVNTVYSVTIEPSGKYGQEQPDNFRDFFITEELSNLQV
jgi:AAA15 family ATPase/GTPase